jgi:hypothetical protein
MNAAAMEKDNRGLYLPSSTLINALKNLNLSNYLGHSAYSQEAIISIGCQIAEGGLPVSQKNEQPQH